MSRYQCQTNRWNACLPWEMSARSISQRLTAPAWRTYNGDLEKTSRIRKIATNIWGTVGCHTLSTFILPDASMVWNKGGVANSKLPLPRGYGWKSEGECKEWVPILTKQLPAPNAIIHLVKCGCTKLYCSTCLCSCPTSGLNCTELCSCS